MNPGNQNPQNYFPPGGYVYPGMGYAPNQPPAPPPQYQNVQYSPGPGAGMYFGPSNMPGNYLGAAYANYPPNKQPYIYRPGSPHISIEAADENFVSQNFNSHRLRSDFIKKVRSEVYMILFCQLLTTGAFIAVCIFIPVVCQWIRSHNVFLYIAYGIFFITYIALVCCTSLRRTFPMNAIALITFTLALSYLAAAISCAYKTHSVMTTVFITSLTCLFISIFAVSGCIDFTKCAALFLVIGIVIFLLGLSCLIVYYFWGYNKILHTVYGGIAAAFFMLYLAFDTQMIIGGRTNELSPEEYIYGALQLYMDVMNIFLLLLSLTGEKN